MDKFYVTFTLKMSIEEEGCKKKEMTTRATSDIVCDCCNGYAQFLIWCNLIDLNQDSFLKGQCV